MPEGGCEECLAIGDIWVHLRYRHARRHWNEQGHGVVRSKEPDEYWAYCYPDDEIVSTQG